MAEQLNAHLHHATTDGHKTTRVHKDDDDEQVSDQIRDQP